MGSIDPPLNPAGTYERLLELGPRARRDAIAEIEAFPTRLREAVAELSDGRLDTTYRNWTVRQIVHHLADSHVNAYVRFRLALTEERPTVKPYSEASWATLEDATRAPLDPSLAVLDGVHARWAMLLRSLGDDRFRREYFHPELGHAVSLDEALGSYAWHGRHHVAQIAWLRAKHAW